MVMRLSRNVVVGLCLPLSLVGFSGCNKKEKATQTEQALTPAESTPKQAEQEAKSKDSEQKSKFSVKVEGANRPKTIDPKLTAERRQAIEDEIAEARGFLVAADLETDLKNDKSIHQDKPAVKALDQAASGKWVLFVGPMTELTPNSFELPFTYTRRSKKDPFGMSKMWFQVEFDDIQGYNSVALTEGQQTVVLAKYDGQKHAGPGYDLVALGLW